MCGVAFLYDACLSNAESARRAESALELMRNRGPDDRGIWSCDGATVAHVRLAILDLGHSRQPMQSQDGRYCLAFNGELYNFRELRSQLEHRWDFHTEGDTEVLLAGLALNGHDFLSSVEGMWAFTLWDRQSQTLLSARDRSGKKPLFYRQKDQKFICASELPALNCLCAERWEEDLDTTADYFRYGYPLPGRTFYVDVNEVRPGHYLTWSPTSGLTERPYWEARVSPFRGSYTQACRQLEAALHASVKRRLVSDVEVGSFLSGGVDSSIVSALAAQQVGSRLKTFTIGFEDPSYDESKFAELTSRYLNVENYVETVSAWRPEALKNLIIDRVGQPFHDSSILPTAVVSGLASRHVKVALSGDGSDELFCGYQRYKARYILNKYLAAPAQIRDFLRKSVAKLPEPDDHHSRSILKKLHLFMGVVDRRMAEDPYVAPCFFAPWQYEELFPQLIQKGSANRPAMQSDESLSDIKRMMLGDFSVYLPQDIHTKVDRASMNSSLEVRAPFMDRAVMELAFSLPIEWTLSWRMNKKILHDTFKGLLPAETWRRRKQGFAVPLSTWFRGTLGAELSELLLSHDGSVLNVDRALIYLQQHREGKTDLGYRLWLLYVYLIWRRECTFLLT